MLGRTILTQQIRVVCDIPIVHLLYPLLYPDYVELWGTGKPLREFLWSEEMADASVYILEHVDFSDVKGETRK